MRVADLPVAAEKCAARFGCAFVISAFNMSIARASLPPIRLRRGTALAGGALRCRRKFLRFFPQGFRDPKYDAWERGYKWEAHQAWDEILNQEEYKSLLKKKKFSEISAMAVRIESRTNLLFSFEKMALRDAVKSAAGAKLFATELFQFLYGGGKPAVAFERWVDAVDQLPRRQTRVLTWPVLTVFPFIACPEYHIFLKPNVTRRAAEEYEFDFEYESRPSWKVYRNLLEFARRVRGDLADLNPTDLIDIQSFLWIQGSSEYDE
jgi:hypothetical protein